MKSLPAQRRRIAVILTAAATMAAGIVLAPATPAHAQQDCLEVTFSTSHWPAGPDGGSYVVHITITNTCSSAASGWQLEFALPPGHTLNQAWSAQWSINGDQVTASHTAWNKILAAGGSVTIGYVGTYTGTFQEPPLSCTINGFPCGGNGNTPPEVALTSPEDGFEDFLGCEIAFAADASDPDGTVDRVEFYVDGGLVGTVDEAPYELELRLNTFDGEHTAFARAFDDGSPALSTDSAAVTFQLLPPPPGTPGTDPCRRGVPPIPPEVSLTSPADGETIPGLCPVPLAAMATDLDGTVTRVEFYLNGELVGTDYTAPYQLDLAYDPTLGGTEITVQARAFDNDDPSQTGFSPQVTFFQPPPPPGPLVIACTPEVEVPAGGSAVAVFADACPSPTQPVEVTVTGDPGVTVSPTSYLPATDGLGDRVTVSAAPGTAGATATVTATSVNDVCWPATTTVSVTG